jgi:hypothetical protein
LKVLKLTRQKFESLKIMMQKLIYLGSLGLVICEIEVLRGRFFGLEKVARS